MPLSTRALDVPPVNIRRTETSHALRRDQGRWAVAVAVRALHWPTRTTADAGGSFVDWPRARLGNPLVDLVSVLWTVAVTGHDPSPIAQAHPLMRKADPHVLDALIAAHAGFCIAGALSPAAPGLDAVVDAKRALAGAFLGWLAHRSPSAA
jgi:hypothetical protein